MSELIYLLCAVMSLLSTLLLFRGYRNSGTRLLFWGSLAFGLLALNNLFLFVDFIVIPTIETHGVFWRDLLSAAAGSLLLFGLIWEMI